MIVIGAAALAGCDRREEAEARRALVEMQARVASLERELDQQKIDLTSQCERRLQAVQMPACGSTGAGAGPEALLGPLPGAADPGAPRTAEAIVCADDRCTLPRATFDAWVKDPTALAKQARVVPNMKDGVTRGFKLFGIRASGPLAGLGLENGDLITAIGGRPLKGMDDALTALGLLKGEEQWTIEGERRGAPFKRTIALSE